MRRTSKIKSCAIVGLEPVVVEVEVDCFPGTHHFMMVGLPDTAVKESLQRVGSAMKNSGAVPPYRLGNLVVNLAPADLKKEGAMYDLPIAVGILMASGQIPSKEEIYKDSLFIGELALNGELRGVRGALPVVISAKNSGFRRIFLPAENARETSIVNGIEAYPLNSLAELISFFNGEINLFPYERKENFQKKPEYLYDMQDIKGQEHVKRAMEIVAAGGHNVCLIGPPGSGKTLIARAFPGILPEMDTEECLEATKIFSVSGKLSRDFPLIKERPFRSPHHTSSSVALIGGGTNPKPGEISLAHRGVLFLDEFLEFPAKTLDCLRQPLEDGIITISRAAGSVTFPARFILIAAMNPCPCGYLNDPEKECTCNHSSVVRYQKKLSGPISDRMDIFLNVPRVKYEKLTSTLPEESSDKIRERVQKARTMQQERYRGQKIYSNAEMRNNHIKKYCVFSPKEQDLLNQAIRKFHLSARSYFRTIKISRTIADLEGSEKIFARHIAEALQYRLQSMDLI